MAGITDRTLRGWLKRADSGKAGDARFATMKTEWEKARVQGKASHVMTVIKHARGMDPRERLPDGEQHKVSPDAAVESSKWLLMNVYDIGEKKAERRAQLKQAVQTHVQNADGSSVTTTTAIVVLPELDPEPT